MHTPELPGGDLGASISASLQHIELIREKEQKLEAARHEAEHQVLHRVGSAFRNGEITDAQLIAIFERYRDLGLLGRKNRWNDHIDIPWNRIAYLRRTSSRHTPNGPEDTWVWVGEWPIPNDAPRPCGGMSVVYVLFDATNEPCYVGSTNQFASRLNTHANSGKDFVRWQAYRCRNREHAYELEDRLLREHKPYLNRKASR